MYVLIVYATSDSCDHEVFGPFATQQEAYTYLYSNYDEDDDTLDTDVLELKKP